MQNSKLIEMIDWLNLSPLGLGKHLKSADPNYVCYANGSVLSTFFLAGKLVSINMSNKQMSVLLDGLLNPHGIIPFGNGYFICNTSCGHVIYLDRGFIPVKSYNFCTLPDRRHVQDIHGKKEWIQSTVSLDNQTLATICHKRSCIFVWDPFRGIYSEYQIDRKWSVQTIMPV